MTGGLGDRLGGDGLLAVRALLRLAQRLRGRGWRRRPARRPAARQPLATAVQDRPRPAPTRRGRRPTAGGRGRRAVAGAGGWSPDRTASPRPEVAPPAAASRRPPTAARTAATPTSGADDDGGRRPARMTSAPGRGVSGGDGFASDRTSDGPGSRSAAGGAAGNPRLAYRAGRDRLRARGRGPERRAQDQPAPERQQHRPHHQHQDRERPAAAHAAAAGTPPSPTGPPPIRTNFAPRTQMSTHRSLVTIPGAKARRCPVWSRQGTAT